MSVSDISKQYNQLIKYLPLSYTIVGKLEHNYSFIPSQTYLRGTLIISYGKILVMDSWKFIKVIHHKKLLPLFYKSKCIKICGSIKNSTISFPTIGYKNKGIQNKNNTKKIHRFITNVIDQSPELLKPYLQEIYFPTSIDNAQKSMDMLFNYEIAVLKHLISTSLLSHNSSLPKLPIYELPFTLTKSQTVVLDKIQKILYSDQGAHILLHGDVGSGKTVIAWIAVLQSLCNGKSVCILASNVSLVNQIANNFQVWMTGDKYPIHKVIHGSMVTEWTEPSIFIGTSALLFRNIPITFGLLVIDEQHKFGVFQREQLSKIAHNILMLSATPIPRSLYSAFQNLITYIPMQDDRKNRRTIYTIALDNYERLEEKIITLSQKEKIFLVCGTIIDAEETLSRLLKMNCQAFIAHSKIHNYHNNISDFLKLSHGILVATTVIEVGIDSNVSYLVIKNIDTLGIAQIYQLIGRVGRKSPGSCFLVGNNIDRIRKIQKINNCFDLSEWDLEQRGGSNLISRVQSGFRGFKFNKDLHSDGKWYHNPKKHSITNVKISHDIMEFFRTIHTF